MKTPYFILILSVIGISTYVGQPDLFFDRKALSENLPIIPKINSDNRPMEALPLTVELAASTASSMSTNVTEDGSPASYLSDDSLRLRSSLQSVLAPSEPNSQMGKAISPSKLGAHVSDLAEPATTTDIHIQLMRWQRFIDGIQFSLEERLSVSHLLKNAEVANASLYGRVIERSLSKEAFSLQRSELIAKTEAELQIWLDAKDVQEFRRIWADNSAQYPATISTRLEFELTTSSSRLFELATQATSTELDGFLSENSVDVNTVDPRNGSSALIKASYAGKSENVLTLLRHGATPNARTQYGRTALLNAVSNGHDQTVALLLAAGADPSQKDNLGMSPLSAANIYLPLGENYEKIAAMLTHAIKHTDEIVELDNPTRDVIVSLR